MTEHEWGSETPAPPDHPTTDSVPRVDSDATERALRVLDILSYELALDAAEEDRPLTPEEAEDVAAIGEYMETLMSTVPFGSGRPKP